MTEVLQRVRRRLETSYWDPESNTTARTANRRDRAAARETRRQLQRQLVQTQDPLARSELEAILIGQGRSDTTAEGAGLARITSVEDLDGRADWLKSA